MDGFMTVPKAAHRAPATEKTIRAEISGGRLKAEKIGPSWVIKEEDFRAWQQVFAATPKGAAEIGRFGGRVDEESING